MNRKALATLLLLKATEIIPLLVLPHIDPISVLNERLLGFLFLPLTVVVILTFNLEWKHLLTTLTALAYVATALDVAYYNFVMHQYPLTGYPTRYASMWLAFYIIGRDADTLDEKLILTIILAELVLFTLAASRLLHIPMSAIVTSASYTTAQAAIIAWGNRTK